MGGSDSRAVTVPISLTDAPQDLVLLLPELRLSLSASVCPLPCPGLHQYPTPDLISSSAGLPVPPLAFLQSDLPMAAKVAVKTQIVSYSPQLINLPVSSCFPWRNSPNPFQSSGFAHSAHPIPHCASAAGLLELAEFLPHGWSPLPGRCPSWVCT